MLANQHVYHLPQVLYLVVNLPARQSLCSAAAVSSRSTCGRVFLPSSGPPQGTVSSSLRGRRLSAPSHRVSFVASGLPVSLSRPSVSFSVLCVLGQPPHRPRSGRAVTPGVVVRGTHGNIEAGLPLASHGGRGRGTYSHYLATTGPQLSHSGPPSPW